MIYFLDADLTGGDSVQHLVESGKVKRYPIPTYARFIQVMEELLSTTTHDDLVIVDTVSKLAETVRENILHKGQPDDSLEEAFARLQGEKLTQNSYGLTIQVIMRRLLNLSRGGEGPRLITVCHEDDVQDPYNPTVKKRGPLLSDKFARSLMSSSSDVFRLYWNTSPIHDANGAEKYPTHTRFLQLKDSDEAVAKYHVIRNLSEKVPRAISDPTLPKIYKKLGKRPMWLTIYGSPGIGKTTLACSEAEEDVK